MATAVPVQAQRTSTRRSRRINLRLILTYLLLTLIGIFFLAPLLWMLSTSLKQPSEYFTQDIRWIPQNPTLEHYRDLLGSSESAQAPVRRWFLNSVIISSAATLLIVSIDALAAYAYARLNFRGKNLIFSILLLTLFMPGIMFLIPNYITIHKLGLLNTYPGVFLPGLASVFGVFFLRQFFSTLPTELEEAARIDGANQFQIFFRIILPLARPALATLAIITFLSSWNDFLWPLLVMTDVERQPLPVGLATLQGAYISEYGTVMAGAVIVAAPVLLLYILLQRYIVKSVATTGLKG